MCDLWKNLSAAQLAAGDFDGALRSADEALQASPADNKAHYRRATALLRLQRKEEAWVFQPILTIVGLEWERGFKLGLLTILILLLCTLILHPTYYHPPPHRC